MKNLLLIIAFMVPASMFAQLGLKAGYNYSNITNAKSINGSSRSGFHAGAFLAPQSKSIVGYRTEVIFSRQGYNYETNSNTGNVDLDYIILPQLTTIRITKYVQIQAGFQVAYLINAAVDSLKKSGSMQNQAKSVMDLYNKFDYGFTAGLELHPVKGLLIGARANFSVAKTYKTITPGQMPNFIPDVNTKNNVIQVFAGWKFAGKK